MRATTDPEAQGASVCTSDANNPFASVLCCLLTGCFVQAEESVLGPNRGPDTKHRVSGGGGVERGQTSGSDARGNGLDDAAPDVHTKSPLQPRFVQRLRYPRGWGCCRDSTPGRIQGSWRSHPLTLPPHMDCQPRFHFYKVVIRFLLILVTVSASVL